MSERLLRKLVLRTFKGETTILTDKAYWQHSKTSIQLYSQLPSSPRGFSGEKPSPQISDLG